jgi:Uma2 family endonuclease
MTATLSPLARAPVPGPRVEEEPEQHFLLNNISWEGYAAIGKALQDRPALRLVYDRGRLELMTTSPRHEIYKKWLSRFLDVLAEELEQPKATAGNMTFQNQALDCGLEADDCFWIEHEPQMRTKLDWDADNDPPPDLALEIEISRNILNRLAIYSALKIGEVWRFDGTLLRILRLQPDGTYQEVAESHCFSGFPVQELARFLALAGTTDDLTIIRQFRTWVRQVLGKD